MKRPPTADTEPLEVHEARWRRRALDLPPARGAAEAARRAAAEAAPPVLRGRRLVLVAAALTLAAAGLLLRSSFTQAPAPPAPPSPPLEEDVLLLWLDPQTPLYLHLQPPRAAGDRS